MIIPPPKSRAQAFPEFAFVHFETRDAAVSAMEACKIKAPSLNGAQLEVHMARSNPLVQGASRGCVRALYLPLQGPPFHPTPHPKPCMGTVKIMVVVMIMTTTMMTMMMMVIASMMVMMMMVAVMIMIMVRTMMMMTGAVLMNHETECRRCCCSGSSEWVSLTSYSLTTSHVRDFGVVCAYSPSCRNLMTPGRAGNRYNQPAGNSYGSPGGGRGGYMGPGQGMGGMMGGQVNLGNMTMVPMMLPNGQVSSRTLSFLPPSALILTPFHSAAEQCLCAPCTDGK